MAQLTGPARLKRPAQVKGPLADHHIMDRHVRWFRREIAVGVAQRLTTEAFVVGSVMFGVFLLLGRGPLSAVVAAVFGVPAFMLIRVGLALAANPLTSAYLLRWPHPGSTIAAVEPTSLGTVADTALKQFRFTLRGAFDEWGGAVTNLYTMDSGQIIVTTSDADDIMAISALADRRLVVSTTQLMPPHERLIVNRTMASDIRGLLTSHLDLLKRMMHAGESEVIPSTMDHVVEVLAIEWDAWDQIGPVIGPFAAVGQRRQPTLLQIQVAPEEILRRTSEAKPIITAQGIGFAPAGHQNALAPGMPPSAHAVTPPTEIDTPALAVATPPFPTVPPTKIDRAA